MSKILLFLISLVAAVIYTLQRLDVGIPGWINNYVNDFLCIPLLLEYMSIVLKKLKNDPNYKFPLAFIFVLASYYSFYFEYYLPAHNPRYTSDIIDVILYFSGGLLYYATNLKKTVSVK